MKEKGIYFATNSIYQKIRDNGGTWNDGKERPIVCLIKSTEHPSLYWAIPMGMFSHRDKEAINRLYRFINLPKSNIASCYYHIGRTTTKSIFFISDVIPITDKYIEREYMSGDQGFVIKNGKLLRDLEDKLKRILAYENANPNYFRQNITSIKNALLLELETESYNSKIAELEAAIEITKDAEQKQLQKNK